MRARIGHVLSFPISRSRTSTVVSIAATTLLVMVLAAASMPADAVIAPHDAQTSEGAASAESQCSALAANGGDNFESLQGATTFITSAKLTTSGTGSQAVTQCTVDGYVTPSDTFIVQLPVSGWNHMLEANGSHGLGGAYYLNECAPFLGKGYATVANSLGHVDPGLNGGFAYDNPQADIDFAYRATHVTTVAAKAIVHAFYGTEPRESYFSGCSEGGRQGLVEAARYPTDFNGIISGPAFPDWSSVIGYDGIYTDVVNRDANGHAILTTAKLPILHGAALQACGAVDGTITDPETCHFDPSVAQCPPANPDGADCLSAAQVRAARLFYGPVRNSRGQAITSYASNEPGSELKWTSRINETGGPSLEGGIGLQFDRYLGFSHDPGPAFQETSFNFDTDPARLTALASQYDANPDLRAFRNAGGKLIMWSGWADEAMPPDATVQFYKAIKAKTGGAAATQNFARLFMVPGEYHCVGGSGPQVASDSFADLLDTWVTTGRAPQTAVAVQTRIDGQVTATRKIHPYPLLPEPQVNQG
ncbi:tannase/feruloyl esterase family alpha/beta hydrolase [Amycolatopsis sp. cmx-4-83]|uniref:tannase/feruloyl esterase family alpha/beta hydrolase n=1 Tax=Amycolatopsis sp. cmx-4-83 TaxID=2790940 RepID=UPI00397C307E